MEIGNPLPILRDLAIKRIPVVPQPETSVSVDDVAKEINKKLGISCTWQRDGTVITDQSAKGKLRIEQTIQESRRDLAGMTHAALDLESRMLQITTGDPTHFASMQEYIEYGFKQFGIKKDFVVNDETVIALTDGLIDHWRTVADQVINNKYGEGVDWEKFIKDPLKRRTLWQTATYLEEGKKGAWMMFRGKGVILESLNDKEHFPSRWLTHTTSLENAQMIAGLGYLDSDDINLSASRIVEKQGEFFSHNITFIFDANDIIESIPLIHGDYGLEKEMKSHVPIPARLARAIVPAGVLHAQEGRGRGSEGYFSFDLVPEKIH